VFAKIIRPKDSMNCTRDRTQSVGIEGARQLPGTDASIQGSKIHDLPDVRLVNHRIHVKKGWAAKLPRPCVSCRLVYQKNSLEMR